MNRLESVQPVLRPKSPASRPIRVPSEPTRQGAVESFFAPQHYEKGYAYPLIVWLHGHGGSERELPGIAAGISERNYVAAGVRGTTALASDANRFTWRQTLDAIDAAHERVEQLVDSVRLRYKINPRRVFLAGHGPGGTMALRLALRAPHEYAGVLSIGGSVPSGHTPLGNLLAARALPVFLTSGATSRRYPTELVCRDLRLLHTAGISITLRNYPCGDEIAPQCLHDMNGWMMECLAGDTASAIVR